MTGNPGRKCTPPRSPTACGSLPFGGANFSRGGPVFSKSGEGKNCFGMASADKVFYTTGRLTSEMVIKSAQMGVPIVVSRSGITQMGHQLAQRLGLCTIGRATNRRFLIYSGNHRLVLQSELASARPQSNA